MASCDTSAGALTSMSEAGLPVTALGVRVFARDLGLDHSPHYPRALPIRRPSQWVSWSVVPIS